MAESEEELEPLDDSERGEWRSWLKTQHSQNENMASGPVTSWQIDGKTVETVTDFIFLVFKITADGDHNREIKRLLFLGRKAMTILDSVLKKQRHYFADKGSSCQSLVFPVVMFEYESWTIKKAEHQRIDTFELWC